MVNNKFKRSLVLSIAGMLLMPLISWAAETEDVIKYRRAVMKAIGGHMSATSLIVRGKVPHKAALAQHVNAMKTLTRDIPALFPEDSDFGQTRAKAEVWEKWDDFKKAADTLKKSVDGMVKAVEAGKTSELPAAFKKVGQGCKGCHKDFRQKDE